MGLRASGAGLVALNVLALSCGAPGTSDAPEDNLGSVEEAIHDPSEPLCDVAVEPGVGCCGYQLTNGITGELESYHNSDKKDFLLNLRAEMPLIAPHDSPFNDDVVFVANGWANHGAVDWLKTSVPAGSDPTYAVRSIAAGQVITVTWDDFMGNTVVIEHTAPSGERYRSVYVHLRHGATPDCQKSKAFVASGGAWEPYITYMNLQTCPDSATGEPGNLDSRVWGTESSRILVQPGDWVEQSQVIAMAGATGIGGIQKGLNPDGSFNNPWFNVHLHMFFTVHAPEAAPAPGQPGNAPWAPDAQWINVDPYGAYASTDSTAPKTNCYLHGANTEGHRLFAPFNPTFAGVSAEHLEHYFDYYPSMGYLPQTMSIYPSGTQHRSAGSFSQHVRVPETTARINRSRTDFLNDLSVQAAADLQLREIQVSSLQGDTRYNGIWTRRTASNPITRIDLDDTTWGATIQGEVNNGRRLIDQFTYQINGARRHAGIFGGDGVPVSSWNTTSNRSLTSFNTFVAQETSFGRKPTSVSAESPADTTYGGMFHAAQGDWIVEPNIIGGVTGFLARNDFHVAQGRRLFRVQGYGNGLRFAAIWVGLERPPSAIMSDANTCGGPGGATVTLDARTSIFDAAFPLGYEWTGPFGVRNGALQTVNLPIGTHFVALRAWDGRGLESLTNAQVDIVQDVTGPTLTPPTARTITTCTNANIGTATATDACGGAITITNNKPTKFPLGNTTVTWTARDQFGNTTARTQIVTAVLGDNSSCCPTGTTIRTGTSVGETITGTSTSECIIGLGGNDTINGNGGNDVISGGSGTDAINGGSGTDACFGGSGTDTFSLCESQTQ